MRITDRYASAIHSSHLKSTPDTTYSDTDVLGAMGLADRELTNAGHALSVALERLFMGDNAAAGYIVSVMANMLRNKAPSMHLTITVVQATDIARACLAWHRDGVCKPCGGHGQLVI